MALNPVLKKWLTNTVREPEKGAAALAALRLDYITSSEWEELRDLAETVKQADGDDPEGLKAVRQWRNLRLMLACFVLLAEDCELEV